MMSDAGSSSMVDGMNDEELFKSGAIFAVNRRFPSNDKISIFHGPDFASDAMMASMKLIPYKEYLTSRIGTKIASAYMNDKPCMLRYIDLNLNVDSQGDTLTYLSMLKSLKHSHLEKMETVGSIQLGNGTSRETKVIIISELGHEVAPLSSHIHERPVNPNQFRKCIKVSMDIARGLEHLHQNDIVHGDITASTVFISNHKGWHAKLSSFFKSCQSGTSTTAVMGSNFASAGDMSETINKSDDIFALGLLMAEMVLGDSVKKVFSIDTSNQTDAQIQKLIRSKRMTVVESKLRKLIPYECPESFEALMCHCCNQDTIKRPNADTCVEALIEIMDDLDDSTTASKDSPQLLHQIAGSARTHIGNKRGSIDPRVGPITFSFNKDTSPNAATGITTSVDSTSEDDSYSSQQNNAIESELNGLKKIATDTASKVKGTNNSSNTDALLHTILEKLDSFETRLSAQQEMILQHKTQELSTSSSSSSQLQQQNDMSEDNQRSEVDNDNNERHIIGEGGALDKSRDDEVGAEIQEQLNKLNFHVNEAKAVQDNLQEKLVNKSISPEKQADVSVAEGELNNVFNSFMGIIDKCSAVTKRTDNVLSGLEHGKEGSDHQNDAHGSSTSENSPSKQLASLLNGKSLSSLYDNGASVDSDFAGSRLSPSKLAEKKFGRNSKGGSPGHPSLQHNPGSTFLKSMGEGIGIKPDPLNKGFWKTSKTGSVYKASGWMLRPSNDSRLGPQGKSVGSAGTPHLCQADSKLLNEFYRADPVELKKERQAEYLRGVYDKNVPYRHQKTGDFLKYSTAPAHVSSRSHSAGFGKGTGGMSSFSGSGLAPAQSATRPAKPESLASILRHQA